jgi:DGQHR domain-containing protein
MFTSTHRETEGAPMKKPGISRPTFLKQKRLKVVSGPKLRSEVPIITGLMPAGVLIPDNYQIPTYNPSTGKGYQRPSQDSRVNELAADLRKGRVDLPTSILLNLRSKESRLALKNDELDLTLLTDSADNELPFFIVDGQHRILALEKLIGDEGVEKWGNFLIPFVCMLGASEAEEMEQFYVVNSRSKPVRTDLAFALLRKITDRDPKMMERLEEKGKGWQVAAEKLVESMAQNSSVWRDLIRLPAMDKGHSTMPSASMVISMKPLLGSPFFGRLSFDQQQQVIEAFWSGIREILRPAFDSPEGFVIQKGVGVVVMHAILVDVMEIVRSSGKSVIEPATYSKIMEEPLLSLQGEAQDGLGTPVAGVEFWRSAPKGAAGSFSSSAGRRVLTSKIRQLLPHVELT